MPTTRQIIFTSRKIPNNSFLMRGEQICAELRKLGYNAITATKNETVKARDSVVIWVRRTVNSRSLSQCRKNNLVIYDPLDRITDLCYNRITDNIDAVIFPSANQLIDYDEAEHLKAYYLYHHWDSRLIKYPHDHFELGYWGYTTSAVNVRNVIEKQNRWTSARVGEFPTEAFFRRISCHYGVRDKKRGLGWRPTTKISTAAACGANIIITRDAMSEELLPKDYPYFVESADLKETLNMINYARVSYGRDAWKYGLECMEKIRVKTSIKRSAYLYSKIIEDLVLKVSK